MRSFNKQEKKTMYKLAEECSELAAELLKACNKRYSPDMLKKIGEELSDVEKRISEVEYTLWGKKTLD